MQVISIDTLLQVDEERDQSKSALPPTKMLCFPESDSLIRIGDRYGFSCSRQQVGGRHTGLAPQLCLDKWTLIQPRGNFLWWVGVRLTQPHWRFQVGQCTKWTTTSLKVKGHDEAFDQTTRQFSSDSCQVRAHLLPTQIWDLDWVQVCLFPSIDQKKCLCLSLTVPHQCVCHQVACRWCE